MLTRISYCNFCRDLGFRESGDDIPSPLIAEYLRAATMYLYEKEPLSTQRLAGAVEARLQPLGYARSRAADEYFEEPDNDSFSPAAVLNLLTELGDLVRIPGGGHYPADSRFVQLDPTLFLVLSALPTSLLRKQTGIGTFFPALARLTSERPEKLPEQSLISWLRVPTLDLKQFASEKMARKGTPFNLSAHEWQIYDSSQARRNWIAARDSSATRGVFLCRFHPDGVTTFQRGVGHIKRSGDQVDCTHFSELSFGDAGRVAHGLHLLSGTFQNLPCRADSKWIELNVSTFESAEILRFLTALSADIQSIPNKRLKFWFSITLRSSLTHFLQRFGINLVFRS
jgi:hypothetical protein